MRGLSILAVGCVLFAQSTVVSIAPLRETAQEAQQTDDPAIWYNRKRPAESLILGTVKAAAPQGALAVYRLDGTRLMSVANIDRPNNVDVGYGLRLGGRTVDFAVVTERNQGRVRVFEILPGRGVAEITTFRVFEGETGQAALPMGVAVYRRKQDGRQYVIVSRKTGPSGSYLWQYALEGAIDGRVTAHKVRAFGEYSGSKEIEAIAVDAEREEVYYSDEGAGIRKYLANPDAAGADQERALFAKTGWKGDREGIAIAGGYVIATDQQHPNSEFHVYDRLTLTELGVFTVGADTTDGIEVNAKLGLFVAMNDSRHNFILADWKKIAAALRLKR
jgi:3-phytase